jgi:hypothetical protein
VEQSIPQIYETRRIKMALVDDFMTSNLKAKIASRFTPTPGAAVTVPYRALEIACECTLEKEADVSGLVAAIQTATGWHLEIIWAEAVVEIRV